MVVEIADIFKEISKIFNEQIKTKADFIEQNRLKLLKQTKIINTFIFIFVILGGFCFFTPHSLEINLSHHFFYSSSLYLVIVAILYSILCILKNNFINEVKKVFYPHIIKALDSKLMYLPSSNKILSSLPNFSFGNFNLSFISDICQSFLSVKNDTQKVMFDILKSVSILPAYDSLSTEDIIVGKYKDRKVNIAEFSLKRYQTCCCNNERRQLYTFFQGIIFQTTLDKNFKSKIIIRKKGIKIDDVNNVKHNDTVSDFVTSSAEVCKQLKKIKDMSMEECTKFVEERTNQSVEHKKLEKVFFESTEFNQLYDVWGEDQVETRYLLTTSLLERLISVYKQGQEILMSVDNNNVTIIIKTNQDMFEPDINKPINDVANYYEVLSQLKTILDLITTLKFDQNIGL